MTRKDYVALAEALAAARPTVEQFTTRSAIANNTFTNHISFDAAMQQWARDRRAIAGVLSRDNPGRFDYDRFYEATEK